MTIPNPTFNVGDIVRRKKSSRNNESYLVGTQPFEVTALEPGFVIDEYGKRHAQFNLKLVEPAKPSPAVELSEYDRKLLEEIRDMVKHSAGVAIEDIKQANDRESANWTGAPQHPESVRDRHIQHIHDLDAVIRRRNETIERQKAQLAEYAAEIEKLKAGASARLELGRDLGHDDRDFGAVREAVKKYVSEMDKISVTATISDTLDAIRALQKRIGEANAAKGFHERGVQLRRTSDFLESAEDAAALRDYCTARLALITTEVAEAIEELRNGRQVDETYYENPPLTREALQAAVDRTPPKPLKPEGVPSEVADVVIRSFDFAHEFGIDLAAMIEEKLAYNATRPKKHGRKF